MMFDTMTGDERIPNLTRSQKRWRDDPKWRASIAKYKKERMKDPIFRQRVNMLMRESRKRIKARRLAATDNQETDV